MEVLETVYDKEMAFRENAQKMSDQLSLLADGTVLKFNSVKQKILSNNRGPSEALERLGTEILPQIAKEGAEEPSLNYDFGVYDLNLNLIDPEKLNKLYEAQVQKNKDFEEAATIISELTGMNFGYNLFRRTIGNVPTGMYQGSADFGYTETGKKALENLVQTGVLKDVLSGPTPVSNVTEFTIPADGIDLKALKELGRTSKYLGEITQLAFQYDSTLKAYASTNSEDRTQDQFLDGLTALKELRGQQIIPDYKTISGKKPGSVEFVIPALNVDRAKLSEFHVQVTAPRSDKSYVYNSGSPNAAAINQELQK